MKKILSHFKLLRGLSWKEVVDLGKFAWRRLTEEQLDQVAGSLTYTSVLALVPILTIAFAIFTTFPMFGTLRASLEGYFIQSLMPKAISNTIMGYVSSFASRATGLSSIGAVVLLFTSLAMMNMIDTAFNRIWHVKNTRPWAQRIIIYWAIITLGPLLIGFSLTVTSKLYVVTAGVLGKTSILASILYTLISVVLSSIAFTLLYMVVPNRPVDWADAAWGGILVGLTFELSKRQFAGFIVSVPSYAMIYGALAAIPLFLVWLYVFWFITLIGAILVASLPVVRFERWRHVPAPGEAFVDAVALLKVLFDAREHAGTSSVSAAKMRNETGLGFDEMERLLDKMQQMQWVGRVKLESSQRSAWGIKLGDEGGYWALLLNPAQLTLADVYRLFVFDVTGVHPGQMAVIKQVEAAIEHGLEQPLSQFFMVHQSSEWRHEDQSVDQGQNPARA
ncbi:MAG: hypothetical protein RL748_3316 [Pseudomonadota bacterium]|jgi:membrane protein